MNRRKFLSLAATALPAALILPELILPKRSIFLPPRAGWAITREHDLAAAWLEYADQVRPAGVLVTAAISPLIRAPAVMQRDSIGHLELVVPEETDAELRARMFAALKEPPSYTYGPGTIRDLFPWIETEMPVVRG